MINKNLITLKEYRNVLDTIEQAAVKYAVARHAIEPLGINNWFNPANAKLDYIGGDSIRMRVTQPHHSYSEDFGIPLVDVLDPKWGMLNLAGLKEKIAARNEIILEEKKESAVRSEEKELKLLAHLKKKYEGK